MGLKLRWSQEIEHVMGKTRKCYLVTRPPTTTPCQTG